jgi:hypothetical protein
MSASARRVSREDVQRAVRRLLAQGEVLLLIPGPPVDDVEKECEVREQGDGGQECGRHGGSI